MPDCLPQDRVEEQLFSWLHRSCPSRLRRREVQRPLRTLTDVPDGSALPGGIASRDVGATLDAAGSARVGGFVTYDISPARVEPHLVAVSQPRSAYCEQFRSLRTRILQAGERLQTRAIVVTSAGIAEGKTLTALNLAWLLGTNRRRSLLDHR